MNFIGILLLAIVPREDAAIVPREDAACERCASIELNHFYDENGRLVFDQLIFLDWNAECACEDVRAWRLVKAPSMIPRRDWTQGGYVVTWQDGEIIRSVRAEMTRETWLQYDPELASREVLPKERRRELLPARKR